jgi:Domain of unknown function (DUF5615)
VTVRFQADSDFNLKIVAATLRREPAIDFRTALDAGLPGLDDPAVLATAAGDGRVLVTHDLKTMPRHFADFIIGSSSPGVVIFPQRMTIAAATENLILIWAATDAAEWVNRIYIVPA